MDRRSLLTAFAAAPLLGGPRVRTVIRVPDTVLLRPLPPLSIERALRFVATYSAGPSTCARPALAHGEALLARAGAST